MFLVPFFVNVFLNHVSARTTPENRFFEVAG
uniref:Uncharacterized protein n=1 Tax=mine drainage metagenome TaxID=410659 RepID=E6QMH3_9ZZZZ